MEITSGSIVRTGHYHHHFVSHYGTWSLVVIMKVTKCHIIINSSITTHNFLGGVLHTYDDTIWAPGTCCNDHSQDDKSYVHSGLRHQPCQRGGREPGQRGGALEADGEGAGHQLTWYLQSVPKKMSFLGKTAITTFKLIQNAKGGGVLENSWYLLPDGHWDFQNWRKNDWENEA